MDWNVKRDELAEEMRAVIIWSNGTDSQQEFAEKLIVDFCKRFAKYLCWGIKDEIITDDEASWIAEDIYRAIDGIDDACWWCNRKNADDFNVAIKLMIDSPHQDSVKKLKKQYSN